MMTEVKSTSQAQSRSVYQQINKPYCTAECRKLHRTDRFRYLRKILRRDNQRGQMKLQNVRAKAHKQRRFDKMCINRSRISEIFMPEQSDRRTLSGHV
jgi:hypothetical protein